MQTNPQNHGSLIVSLAFSLVTQRLWGGALRDETKNGCEGDYQNHLDIS